MKNHLKPSNAGPKLVGVRELKIQAARIARDVRDSRASYVLTHRGRAVAVILPLDAETPALAAGDSATSSAWTQFLRAGQRLQKRFRPGVSGVKMLSAARR
jgi:antitoxin (DNA-binding transcriptional repressor) of toxin-antitoxin stability system